MAEASKYFLFQHYFIQLFLKKTRKDISKDKKRLQVLRKEVEKAKRALSTTYETKIHLDSFIDGVDFSEKLTRARFEDINKVSDKNYACLN